MPSRTDLVTTSILFLLSLIAAPLIQAQNVSDDQVKAAYVYSFAKFIEWPTGIFASPSSPIRFCVLNDRSFGVELGRIVTGRSVAGHTVDVVQVQDAEESRNCQVLFIGSGESRQTRHILETLRGIHILTIGETETFLQEGGIINFVAEDEHVHFEVNHKAASEAGLYISSRLLGVAKRVIE